MIPYNVLKNFIVSTNNYSDFLVFIFIHYKKYKAMVMYLKGLSLDVVIPLSGCSCNGEQ